MPSVAEAELYGLFLNTTHMASMRNEFNDMNQPQSSTPIKADKYHYFRRYYQHN